jgi:hypothetical protein
MHFLHNGKDLMYCQTMSQYLILSLFILVINDECERQSFKGQFSFPILKVVIRKFPKKSNHGFPIAIWVESKKD